MQLTLAPPHNSYPSPIGIELLTVPGYPKVQCELVECPAPYMGEGVQPGAPPDRTLPAQDPFGTGECDVNMLLQ